MDGVDTASPRVVDPEILSQEAACCTVGLLSQAAHSGGQEAPKVCGLNAMFDA